MDYKRDYEAAFRDEKPIKALRHSVRQSAGKKGLTFALSWEWFVEHVTPMRCKATGVPLSWGGLRGPWKPSIDRVDPAGDYTPDNCRVVCWLFNRAKSHWSDADMLTMAQGLVATVDPDFHKE